MTKTEIAYIEKIAARTKQCLLGKIAADIKSRLPEKPEERTDWEKYQLIKQGSATVKMNMRMKEIQPKYGHSDSVRFTDGFTYPPHAEMDAYNKAAAAIQAEKDDREMAVELAFNRAVDERILGKTTSQEYLDEVERLAQQQW